MSLFINVGSEFYGRRLKLLIILVAGLFVLLRAWNLGAYGLWLDEVLTVNAARQTFAGLLQFAAGDVVHPPFFYILLKIWIGIGGESLLWLRLLPFLAAVLTIWPLRLLSKELEIGPREEILTLFFTSANAYLILYAQELRMYSFLLLFSVTSIAFFVRFLNTQKQLLALFLVNLVLIYTHYYGWLVVGTQLIVLIIYERKLLLRFTIPLFALILLFSPWAYIVASTVLRNGGVANIGWIATPGVKDVLMYYSILAGFPGGLIGIFGILIFAIPVVWNLRSLNRTSVALLLFSVAPVLIAFLFSQRIPVWHHRYLIICSMPFLLLVAKSVFSLDNAVIRNGLIVLMIAWTTFAGISGIREDDRIDWRRIAAFINESNNTSTVVYTFGNDQTAVPLQFYLERQFKVEKVDALPAGFGYWVVYRESRSNKMSRLEEVAINEGNMVENLFVDGQPGHSARVFFVNKP